MSKTVTPLQRTFGTDSAQIAWKQFSSAQAGPNDSLREFVETHRTDAAPLTPTTLPVSQRVKKAGCLYDVHSYWSKKPYLAIERFIEHYTNPGALVLDPFVGGGSTLQAAVGTGRKAIGVDLSPSAAHIAANTTSYLSIQSFQEAAERIFSVVSEALASLYTVEYEGSKYVVSSFIHSEQIRCIKCLRLFSIINPHSSDARSACPHCGETFSTRSRNLQFGPDEIVACELRPSLSARRGQLHWLCDNHLLGAKLHIKDAQVKAAKLRKLHDITVPQRILDFGGRLTTSGSTTLGKLYDDHSLVALSAIKEAIQDVTDATTKGKLLLAFSAILKNCSKMYRFHEGGGGSPIGAYYVPPIRKELNPLFAFREKLDAIGSSLQEISEWGSQAFVVSNQSSALLDVPSNSVDYVFTDPPYADTMPFGDLNFLWDGWLFPESLVRTGEAIGESWYPVMLSVFKEVYRVLKPGACCSVCYHDTSEGTWGDLLDLMAEAGFKAIIGKDVLYIETTQRAYQQTVADKVVKRDHVVNFVKPVRVSVVFDKIDVTDNVSIREATKNVIADFLSENSGVSKDRVYDEVVARMFQSGRMDTSIFEGVLREVADEVKESSLRNVKGRGALAEGSGRLYLKSTADAALDLPEVRREDAAAARLNEFVTEYMKKKPEHEGVHYSDLFEQYLPIQDKPRRLLAEWLVEYFIKTPSGTWRVPDSGEGNQLAKLREAGTLRRIKRFANALMEGIPVRDNDRPSGDVDLLGWLRQCRRAGLYEQGRAIFEKGGLNSASLTEEQQIEAEDDYRICARRGSTEEAKPKPKRSKIMDDEE